MDTDGTHNYVEKTLTELNKRLAAVRALERQVIRRARRRLEK